MLIDFHTHAFPARLIPKIRKRYGERGWGLSDGTVEGLRQSMAANGVDACVLLNLVSSPASQRKVNAFALEARGPGLVSFGSVHPLAEGALEELDYLKEAGVPGIKLHPADQGYSIEDPRCFPVFERIAELGFITLFHIDSPVLGPSRNCLPGAFARAVERFKGGPVVCAHMGSLMGADAPDLALLSSLPVYVDTALSSLRPDPLELGRLIRAFGADRVLFGSDSPWTSQAKEIAAVRAAGLAPGEEEAVFHGNAERLLGPALAELASRPRAGLAST